MGALLAIAKGGVDNEKVGDCEKSTNAQWREFEVLLAILGPAYQTPAHEYSQMREAARHDLPAALICYRSLLAQITAVG